MELDEKRLAKAFTTVGKAVALMPGVEGDGWSEHIAKKAGAVRDVAALVRLVDAGEPEWNFAVALLLREAAADKPKKLVVEGLDALPSIETDIGDFRVHHGDLRVDGDLELEESLIVTGDLDVGGVLDVSPEWLSLHVGGDVRARAASFGKDEIMIGGTLAIETVVAVYESTVGVGGGFEAGLVIEWMGEVDSKKKAKVKHRCTPDDVRSYARATREKLQALLVPEAFSAKDEDDDVLAIIPRLLDRVRANEPIWRTKPAPAKTPKIPPRLAKALKKKDAEVDLSGMQLTALPPEIGALVGVRKLKLEKNSLTTLPPEIGALTSLRELWLSRNTLEALPAEIGALAELQFLIAPNNAISDLPPSFARLTKLEILNVIDNKFEKIPTAAYALPAVKRLAFADNPLRAPDAALGDLTSLETLELGGAIDELPDVFAKLTNLVALRLSGGTLAKLPPSIAALTSVKYLTFQSTRLTRFPDEVLGLSALEDLTLSGNPIAELPTSLAKMTSLRTLSLSGMKLTSVPDAVFELPGLKYLYLTGNAIPEKHWPGLRDRAKVAKMSIYLQ